MRTKNIIKMTLKSYKLFKISILDFCTEFNYHFNSVIYLSAALHKNVT